MNEKKTFRQMVTDRGDFEMHDEAPPWPVDMLTLSTAEVERYIGPAAGPGPQESREWTSTYGPFAFRADHPGPSQEHSQARDRAYRPG